MQDLWQCRKQQRSSIIGRQLVDALDRSGLSRDDPVKMQACAAMRETDSGVGNGYDPGRALRAADGRCAAASALIKRN